MSAKHLPVGLIALAIVGFLLPLTGDDFLIRDLGVASLSIALVVMSVSFLAGFGGMVSFSQTAVAGIAGYSVAILVVRHGWSWETAALGAVAAAAVAGFVIGLLAARAYGLYFVMITLALGLMVYYYTGTNFDLTNGTAGLYGVNAPRIGLLGLDTNVSFYYLCLIAVLAAAFFLRYLLGTQFGLTLQASRDNPARLQALGYNVYWHRVWAFTIASGVAGLGGVLNVWYVGGIAPGTLDVTRTVIVVVMAVLGGVMSLSGPILGAWLVTYLSIFMSTYTGRYNTVIGVIFVVVLYVAPGGLGSIAKSFGSRSRRLRSRLGPANLARLLRASPDPGDANPSDN